MNIAMEETQEYRDGVLRETYRDAFIRGNNGKDTATDVMSAHFRRIVRAGGI